MFRALLSTVLRSSSTSSSSSFGQHCCKWIQSRHIVAATRGEMRDVVLPVTNWEQEDKGTVTIAGDIFDVPIRKDIVHHVVKWQRAKRRKGTHSTKTRGEVAGSTRKINKQKGTGKARHGSRRAPQFRGGGVAHGPKPRSYEYKLNKKVRRLGLKIALSARVAERKLMLFDNVDLPTHKTRQLMKLVPNLGCRRVLIVDGVEKMGREITLACRNVKEVNVIPAKGLNVYSILLHDTLVMSVAAVREIEDRLHTPINR
ncbi:uncharacterized protein LOC9649309 [Selaginella moellendorffii]|nr:uncharacterized protein LOC9649309 [Selaginella moellendorffii]|eukprot:XP_024514992.1 uncharacterized protein LOC9649309 [Selaginella moellendorffii]